MICILFVVTQSNANLITNGDFASSANNWDFEKHDPADGFGRYTNGEFQLSVTAIADETYKLRLVQKNLQIDNGNDYLLSFDSRGDEVRPLEVGLQRVADPYTWYNGKVFTISQKVARYHAILRITNPTDNNSQLSFQVGKNLGALYLDNISLTIFNSPLEIFGISTTTISSIQDSVIFPLNDFVYSRSYGEELTRLQWTAFPQTGNVKTFIDPNSRELTITANNIGIDTVTLQCSDPDNNTTVYKFAVFVGDGGVPQISSIPNQVFNQGNVLPSINLDNYVVDSDHNNAELAWSFSGNDKMQLSISNTRVLQVTSLNSPNQPFQDTITLIVSDPDNNSDTTTVTYFYTLNPNTPPQVVANLENITLNEDFTDTITHRLKRYFTDAEDGTDLNYQVSTSDNTLIEVSTIEDTLLQLRSKAHKFGTATIEVTAEDKGGLSVSNSFVLTVNAVNDNPIIQTPLPDLSLSNTIGDTTLTKLTSMFFDPEDGTALTYNALSSNSSLVTTNITSDSSLQIAIVPNSFGSCTISVSATDRGNNTSVDSFVVTVTTLNTSPVIVNPIANMNFLANSGDTLIEDLYKVFNDNEDHDSLLQYSANSSNSNLLTARIESNRFLYFKFTDNQVGTASIYVSATDRNNMTTTDTVSVTVVQGNSTPILETPLANVILQEDFGNKTKAYDLKSNFRDSNNGALSFTIGTYDTTAITIRLNGDGTVDLNSVNNAFDTIPFAVTATNQENISLSDTALIIINPVNDIPVITTTINDTAIAVYQVFSRKLDVINPDSTIDTITWKALTAPKSLELNAKTGLIRWTPNREYLGQNRISIIAQDQQQTSDTISFTVNVFAYTEKTLPFTPGTFSTKVEKLEGIVLSENPIRRTTRSVTMVLPKGEHNSVKLTIIDPLGNTLYTKKEIVYRTQSGRNYCVWNVSDNRGKHLQKGSYLAVIQTSRGIHKQVIGIK